METVPENKLEEMLSDAHAVKTALFRPIEERQKAGQAISECIIVAAEYRAQRDALAARVVTLQEQIKRVSDAIPETIETYILDVDQLAKLRKLSDELMGGTDRERDYGHRLWLLVGSISAQQLRIWSQPIGGG